MVPINGYFDFTVTGWEEPTDTKLDTREDLLKLEYLCQKLCSRDVPTKRDVQQEYTFH